MAPAAASQHDQSSTADQMRLGLEIRRRAMPEREITNKQTIRTLYEEVLNEGRLELLRPLALMREGVVLYMLWPGNLIEEFQASLVEDLLIEGPNGMFVRDFSIGHGSSPYLEA